MSASDETAERAVAGRKVMDLLARQLELYRRLEQLADGQRRAIQSQDTQSLMKLLTERRKLTTALTELNSELAPYRASWDRILGAMDPADRSGLEERVTQAGERLGRILERDEADGRLLAAQKTHTAQRLGELDTARRTLTAYGDSTGSVTQATPILNGTEA